MTRRAIGLAALAVLLLGAALVGVGSRPPGEAHAATICAKHTKRVVRHVKRHGKRTRVVRFQHRRVCRQVTEPGPTPVAPAPGDAGAPSSTGDTNPTPAPSTEPPATTPAPEAEPEANAIGVAADDHGGVKSYTLSRQTVRSGRLTVQLQNKGEDPHDMEMQRVGPDGEALGEPVEVPVTAPGAQTSRSFEVEPGEYRMWCNLYHHAEEGMEATVKVE